ncbi:MAG: hypothetical protein ACYSXD_02625 [Planctomycetota bacterium]|jgi:hypothetical protein
MKKLLVYVILFSLFITVPVWATSTGLNNIPTADVVPEKVLVFQYFSELGNDNVPDHFIGFKYGLMKNIEVGLDGRISPEKAKEENLVAQGKVRFELSDKLALGLGVTNLGDRDKAGAEFPFAVLSQDIDFLRVHFGGTSQDDNEGFFGGIDKTISFLDRDLMLRSDIIQVNNQNDTITSFGFIYDLGNNFLVESWMSFPSESDKEDFVTIKLNYVIKF